MLVGKQCPEGVHNRLDFSSVTWSAVLKSVLSGSVGAEFGVAPFPYLL